MFHFTPKTHKLSNANSILIFITRKVRLWRKDN